MFRLSVDFGASGSAYTLVADAGSYVTQGQAATLGLVGGADTTAPSWGSATLGSSNVLSTSYTLAASANATDAVGVTGYRYRINGGAWVTGSTRSFTVTGRTASATDFCEMQARDAAGNWSTSISVSVTLLSAAPVAPSSTGSEAAFRLSTAAGVTNETFTVGMPLLEGQFDADITVSGITDAQVDVRNRWPDGTAKFAVISGKVTLAAAGSLRCVLQPGLPGPGVALDESDLTVSGIEATLQFAGGPVMTLSSLIGVAAVGAAGGLTTDGRVRQLVSGPQMSSWLYAARLSTTNAHLIGWMEVRVYNGGRVHILPWIENGFTRISGCAGQAGTLTFTMGGVTRFLQADVHIANHCRVVAQDSGAVGHWSGVATDLYAAPDPMYMQATGLVPNYFVDTTGATAKLNGLSQAYSPTAYGQLTTSPRDGSGNGTANGDFDTGMSNAGYHAGIGLIPEWDAFYLTSNGDQRAWKAVVSNAMGYGRYSVHFRDELTLAPVNPADVPNKTLPQGSNHNIADVGANQFGGAETLPAVAGYATGTALGTIKPEYWAQTHHPSAGYTAYLLTGHEFFLDLCQFVAATCFLRQNNVHRQYGLGRQKTDMETVRGQAWALRTIFQAATISRDGSALRTGLSTLAANNIGYYDATYISGALGVCGAFGTPRNSTNFRPDTTSYRVNAFEYDFSVGAWGYGLAMKPVSGADLDKMRTYATWHAQWPVARLGPLGDATTYGFNAACRTNFIAIAPGASGSQWSTNTGWFANPGEMFAVTPGGSNASNTTNTIGAYVGDDASAGYFPDATSYWGNLQVALLYAVELGVAGATDAYKRMIGASNWSSFESSAINAPVYAHSPRNVMQWGTGSAVGSVTGDTWIPGKDAQGRVNKASWATVPTGRWIEVSGTRIDQQLTAQVQAASAGWTSAQLWGTTAGNSLFQSWAGFGVDETRDRLWFLGGGHSDGFNNGLYRFDCNRMQWSIECPPSPRALMSPSYLAGGSSTYHPVSGAAAAANFNANNPAGTIIGTLVPAADGPFFDQIPDDGKPTARHTYEGIAFAPELGASGSVLMHARRLWRYDLAAGRWVWKRLVNDRVRANVAAPNAGGCEVIHSAESALIIWDEATQRILCSASGSAGGGAYAFDWGSQAWSSWGGSYGLNYNHAGHARYGRTITAFNPPYSGSAVYVGRYWRYNIDTNTQLAANVQLGGGLTFSAFVAADSFYDGESLVYVPEIDRYWVCTRNNSGGMQWLTLDPTTTPWTLSPLTFSNTPPVTQRLINGRVKWMPNLRAVLVWDHCFVNAQIYRF